MQENKQAQWQEEILLLKAIKEHCIIKTKIVNNYTAYPKYLPGKITAPGKYKKMAKPVQLRFVF
jgi:hypothetical protein